MEFAAQNFPRTGGCSRIRGLPGSHGASCQRPETNPQALSRVGLDASHSFGTGSEFVLDLAVVSFFV